MPVHLVFCSCPDSDTAQRLAAALVEARLAACVSLLPPMRSVYRWQGAIEQADEVLLLAKTAADRTPALVSRLRELHPYELPEIVAVEAAAGLPAYLDWVVSALRLQRIEASVLDGNPASARVLEKNGFQEEGRRRAAVLKADGFHDLRLFGRLWSR